MSAAPQVIHELSQLLQARNWAAALVRIDALLKLNLQDARLHLYRAQCLMGLGEKASALAAAQRAEEYAPSEPIILDAVATLYGYAQDLTRSLSAYDRAVAAEPGNSQFRYNRASVRCFAGDLEGAEQDYDECISLNPRDFEAYKNRSDLHSQSRGHNHVAELHAQLSAGISDWRGEVQLRYALAKELEDLGDYTASFEELRRAASQRRGHMRYDVAADLNMVQWIIEAYPQALPATVNAPQDSPIFVLGLPRSGTTLVERILSSHSALVSAGELDSFALALVDQVRRASGSSQMARQDLVRRSAQVDFVALGAEYLKRAYAACLGATRFIDKMPLNYLYCELIRRALPRAKIIHVSREPMAVCYAMYKALFKDAYPFSYDLQDIARYYAGYRRLMDHWQALMPDGIHTIRYEALVADQAGESRRLLDFCGLEWQESCVQFHKNPSAATTASAAQVRRPIYDSSVAQWRHYEAQLAGLRSQLEAAGIHT
jgi:tetratricopeptide (TPR) repeat protein